MADYAIGFCAGMWPAAFAAVAIAAVAAWFVVRIVEIVVNRPRS